MIGPKTKVTVKRRTEGARNVAGEAIEAWDAVTGGSNIKVHIQPLSAHAKTTLTGLLAESTHKVFIQKKVDIMQDDRVLDADGNYYSVKSVSKWHTHTEALVSISNIQ